MTRLPPRIARARAHGTQPNASASGTKPALAKDGEGACAHRATTPLTAAVVLVAALSASPSQGQMIAAPEAPATQRPVLLTAPNGVPLVNIQTPSAAGVSRNVYQQFNVGPEGAILNNSRGNVQTQLGGWVQGNPNLATGPARIILNEVNGGDASRLRGYLEVGGQRAEVIIANPAGIAVDGGGFINASRATLTTGTPQFNSFGGLDSFLVRGGTITIDGKGLDASKTDYAAILARAVQANAGIWASELKVVTGANQISADHAQVAAAGASGSTPTYALDVAALGGMYAGKIVLVGTEAGLGVRNAGTVQAASTSAAQLAGAGQLVVTSAGRLENIGTLQATTDASLSASTFDNSGRVSSGANLKIATQGALNNRIGEQGGTLEGSRLELNSAGDLDNRGGTLRQTSGAALALSAPSLSNRGGNIGLEPIAQTPTPGTGPGNGGTPPTTPGGGTPGNGGGTPGSGEGGGVVPPPYQPPSPGLIAAAGTLRNDGGRIYAGGAIALHSADLDNQGGSLSVADMTVDQPRFDNRGGTLNIGNVFNARVEQFDNSGGKLNAGRLNISASGDLLNRGGTLTSASDAQLAVGGTLDNSGGTIAATGVLAAAVSGAAINNAGTLIANRDVGLTAATLDNAKGSIQSAQAGARLNVVGAVSNAQGQIGAAGDLHLQAGSLANSGSLRGANDVTITTGGVLGNDGSITAGRNALIAAGSLQGGGSGVLGAGIQADGKLAGAGQLQVTTSGALVAHGTQLAAGKVSLQGASVDISAGQTSAAEIALTATQGNVDTSRATVATAGRLSVVANTNGAQSLINQAGKLNAGELDIRAANIANTQGGEIVQTGTAASTLAVSGTLNNDGGRIASNGQDLGLQGAAISNRGGKIEHAGSGALKIAGGRFDGDNGHITGNGGLLVELADAFNQDGGKTSAKQIAIEAGELSNRGGQIVQTGASDTRIGVRGVLDNSGGIIASNGQTRVAAGSLSNRAGTLRAAEGSALGLSVEGLLDNSLKGEIGAGGNVDLRAGGLNNDSGRITSVGDVAVDTQGGAATNIGGTIAGNGNARILAASLDNSGGTVAAVRGNLDIATAGLTRNDGGSLQAGARTMLANGGLSNRGGKVFGDSLSVDTRGNALDNSGKGALAATQTVTLKSGLLNNDSGVIQSGKAMSIDTGGQALINTNAAGASNGQGGISSADTLTLNTGTVNNNAGFIGAKQALVASTGAVSNSGGTVLGESGVSIDTHGATYDNRGGRTQAKGDLTISAGALDNSGALIRSLGKTTLNAGHVVNAGTSGANLGIEGGSVAINTGGFDNRSGAIRADANVTIASGGTVDNRGGLISAGDTVAIVDPNAANPAAKTLDLINGNGTLVADKLLKIDAARFSGDGRAVSGKDLSIALTQDVVNNGEVGANGNVSYTTTGNFTNHGKLVAGQTLTVAGRNVDNTAGAEISAGTTIVRAADTLTNRGLIDGHDTRLDAGTLNNIGTGRVYGDLVSIGAGTVNNDAENVGGTIKAGTIAARSRLDIGAGTLNNREHALIFSAGDLFIGGALNGEREATGQGGTLNNFSADIESLGDLSIAMGRINNWDVHIRKGPQAMPPKAPTVLLAPIGGSGFYTLDQVIFVMGSPIVYLRNPDGTPGQLLTVEGFGLWTTSYAVTEDTATDVDPSRIVAGGDMALSGAVHNKSSKIIAGGTLTASDVTNEGLTGNRRIVSSTIVMNHKGEIQGSVSHPDINETIDLEKYTPLQNVNAVQGYNPGAAGTANVDAHGGGAGGVNGGAGPGALVEVPAQVGAVIRASGASAGTAGGANGADGTGSNETIPMVVRTSLPNATVPRASLFGLRPDAGSRYLIETDPRFANHRQWLSSDYLLSRMGFQPEHLLKRLGDGFYEQKLIREQVAQLTGYRYLDGFGSDETQYTALMNAGATFAQQYGLRPGVALTAAQMAQLTSDIVWLVEQTVSLPDGGTQRVLVPQVYVRVRPGDIDGSGALLAGNAVRIGSAGDVVNTGTIAGRALVSITAENVNNLGGRIAGANVAIDARNDLNNIGGSITARDSAVLTAGRDINIRTTTQNSTGLLTGSNIDRIAGVYVTDPGGVLLASAERDLNLTGAILSNVGQGSRTLANAGRDVNLGTVTLSTSAHVSGSSGDTTASGIAAHSREVGSQIVGGGSVAISAGHDVQARAAQVAAGGTLAVSAENDIRIDAGQSASAMLAVSHTSSKKLLSRSSSDKLDGESETRVIGSSFSGDNVVMSAGNDLVVRGSEVSAVNQAVLSAGRDVRIESAQEHSQSASFASSKSSGFKRNLTDGLTYSKSSRSEFEINRSTEQVGSSVNGGNVSIDAGRDAQIIASNVIADRNVGITAGRNIDILAAQDTSDTISASDKNDRTLNLRVGYAPKQTFYSRTRKGEDGTGQSSTAVTSLISANNGNLSLYAGADPKYAGTGQGNVTTEGANLLAKNRVGISGNAVNLMAATSTEASKKHKESSGHTIGAELTGYAGSAITSLYKRVESARTTSDDRLRGALVLKSGYDAYKLVSSDKIANGVNSFGQAQDPTKVASAVAAGSSEAALANNPSGAAFGIAVSESRTRERSDTVKVSTSQRGTNIQAGSIDITARESDINVEGGKLQARDIVLDAKRDINLYAARNTAATLGTSSGSNLGGGVTFGFGSQNGFSIQVEAGNKSGRQTGFEVSHDNTLVTATDSLKVKSGRDTNLRGAQLAGDSVEMNVGRNLNIESLQDVTSYVSRESSSGFSLSLCIPPICYGEYVSGSVSASSQRVNHLYQSATGQSGISAGNGGYDIVVRGNTDLKGGAITSTAAPDKNSLTTASLTSSDLVNQQKTNSSSSSLNMSFSSGANAYSQGTSLAGNAISSATSTALANLTGGAGLPAKNDESSHTLSVISPGNIKITGTGNAEIDDKSRENVATLTVRDPETANGALVNTLTLQQAEEIPKRQQEAKERQRALDIVGGVVNSVIGDVSEKLNKQAQEDERKRAEAAGEPPRPVTAWQDGSIEKTLLHGLAGAIQAKIGDGSALLGLAVGTINEQLTPMIGEYLKSQGLDPKSDAYKALVKAGSTLLGAAVGAALGDAGLGADLANTATSNNYLKHMEVVQKNKEIVACRGFGPCIEAREAYWNEVSIERNRQIDMSCTMQAPEQCRANLDDMREDLLELKQYASGKGINPYTSEEWTNLSQVAALYQANLERLAAIGANELGSTYATPATLYANGYLTKDEADALALLRRGTFVSALGTMLSNVSPGKSNRQVTDEVGAGKSTTIRIGDKDVDIIERNGTVSRYNPATDRYEPIGAGAEVPSLPSQNPPLPGAPPIGLPAPAGYVIMPMKDSSGTSIPVVIASDKFAWGPTDPKNLIGSQNVDHERAAERFIRSTVDVVSMVDARRGNNNGFDPSYIKRDANGNYQLVIVEDKSGSMPKITAFGEGKNGEAQFIKNLASMRDTILNDPTIPNLAKISALDQIDRRTFLVQLFVGPSSNPSLAQLDNIRQLTNNQFSLTNITVLPRVREPIKR
ncbi:hemagglutinin repeat-containing protein [Lysobacter antibioticus]|uniref:hemagglutinin repeat-containing protein n=1 Tax=Lysobacter antibioticus TaxID=84531 RepID=UPI0009DCC376|nr:hemagglutinin repeat-containing protein [Lysobacter antibioticus]